MDRYTITLQAEEREQLQALLRKGVKIMAIVDRNGLPLSVSTHAANHHEVTLQLQSEVHFAQESLNPAIRLNTSLPLA